MKVITVAATKGGVGKTTITSGLAVQIAKEETVAMIDTDPQKSLELWYSLRKNTENMALIKNVDDLEAAKKMLAEEGADWLLIDTAPSNIKNLIPAIQASDFVLIPTKAGAFDVTAIDPVIELCHQNRKDHVIVINMAYGEENGIPDDMVAGTAKHLRKHSGQVLENVIENRKEYASASFSGQSAPEITTNGKSADEMEALWLSVKKLARRFEAVEE